jgi:hypothetical protein
MRASIFTIIILSTFSGCSEYQNPAESVATSLQIETETSSNIKSYKKLIWKHDGIAVEARGEHIVYADVYCDLRNSDRSKVLVTFDSWTDADTTSYISNLLIECEGQTLFFESGGMYINRHHEILLENSGSMNLRFYISLWCDEVECNSTASLRISKINVYKQ